MKPTRLLAVLSVLALAAPALADEPTIGVIDATTTSKTNHEASTPFPNSTPHALAEGFVYSLQCVGADVYATTVSTSTGTVTSNGATSAGTYLVDKSIWYFKPKGTRTWVAVKTVSGTADCRVKLVTE